MFNITVYIQSAVIIRNIFTTPYGLHYLQCISYLTVYINIFLTYANKLWLTGHGLIAFKYYCSNKCLQEQQANKYIHKISDKKAGKFL